MMSLINIIPCSIDSKLNRRCTEMSVHVMTFDPSLYSARNADFVNENVCFRIIISARTIDCYVTNNINNNYCKARSFVVFTFFII